MVFRFLSFLIWTELKVLRIKNQAAAYKGEFVVIQQAGLKDLEDLLSLYRELNPQDLSVPLEEALAVWTQMLTASPMIKTFIGREEKRLVAACSLITVPNLTRGLKPWAVLENVVTASGCRCKGFGKMIVNHAVKEAEAMGCYKVMLLSSASRSEAHRFYEALGFDGSSKKGYQIRF